MNYSLHFLSDLLLLFSLSLRVGTPVQSERPVFGKTSRHSIFPANPAPQATTASSSKPRPARRACHRGGLLCDSKQQFQLPFHFLLGRCWQRSKFTDNDIGSNRHHSMELQGRRGGGAQRTDFRHEPKVYVPIPAHRHGLPLEHFLPG